MEEKTLSELLDLLDELEVEGNEEFALELNRLILIKMSAVNELRKISDLDYQRGF